MVRELETFGWCENGVVMVTRKRRVKKIKRVKRKPGMVRVLAFVTQGRSGKSRSFGVDVLPCPCCGSVGIYVGPDNWDSFGVRCSTYSGRMVGGAAVRSGCGLKVSRSWPEKLPRGMKYGYQLDKSVVLRAVGAWNERVEQSV